MQRIVTMKFGPYEVYFNFDTIDEAAEFMKLASKSLDPVGGDANKFGINLEVFFDDDASEADNAE